MSPQPAIFLDRDGTLNVQIVRNGKPYPPDSLDEFRLFPGVESGCRQLKAAGFALVVATNQPDVGRGKQTRANVEAMHERLRELLPELDLIQVCYHAGDAYGESCACRKPKPGMLTEAADRLGLDLQQSWMIGDRWGDIDAGHTAGCRTILIDHGYAERPPSNAPNFTVSDFAAAVRIILAQAGP